jgi:hypothetical protein
MTIIKIKLETVEDWTKELQDRKRRAWWQLGEPLRAMTERGEFLEFKTLEEICELSEALGNHWFSKETLAFFGGKVYGPVIGGRYFISSEHTHDRSERRYTVRECQNGSIETASEFLEFATLMEARRAAKRIAGVKP